MVDHNIKIIIALLQKSKKSCSGFYTIQLRQQCKCIQAVKWCTPIDLFLRRYDSRPSPSLRLQIGRVLSMGHISAGGIKQIITRLTTVNSVSSGGVSGGVVILQPKQHISKPEMGRTSEARGL